MVDDRRRSAAIFTPADREEVLARAIALLDGDERVEAAVITGSIGAGRADRWSDFDLAAIVADGESSERLATEWEKLAYREWPVVHHYATTFGTTIVRGFLLRNGLLADLAFTPVADFEAWAPVHIVFDRAGTVTRIAAAWHPWTPTPDWRGEAGFAFHDVLHGSVSAWRGEPWRSLYYLQRIRNRTLALASERHGHDSDELAHADELPAEELAPLERTLVADLAPERLLAAIEAVTRAFLDELARGDGPLAERLDEPLLAFVRALRGQQDG